MEPNSIKDENHLYPVFLKLDGLEVLLVGGGNVGYEKLASLLSNSPHTAITVVAPLIKEEVEELVKSHSSCKIIQRSFQESDLENVNLVICATDDKELHKKIKRLANEKKILVNVADTPELCDFYLGSIAQKGNLKIAISTNGKSPTAAKRIRELLENSMPDEIDELLNNLHLIRSNISGDFAEKVRQLNELTRTMVEKN